MNPALIQTSTVRHMLFRFTIRHNKVWPFEATPLFCHSCLVHCQSLIFQKFAGAGILSASATRCCWCNCHCHRKWTWWPAFKSWTRLFAFHIVLTPLGKAWIQLFSFQLWVNSKVVWDLSPAGCNTRLILSGV